MVTPENGTLILQGVSGRQYSYSIYSSDVVGAAVTFSTTGAAGSTSQNFIIIPENCFLKDVSIATGQTVSVAVVPYTNDVPTGVLLSWANCVNTLNNRAIPQIGLAGGKKLTLIQA